MNLLLFEGNLLAIPFADLELLKCQPFTIFSFATQSFHESGSPLPSSKGLAQLNGRRTPLYGISEKCEGAWALGSVGKFWTKSLCEFREQESLVSGEATRIVRDFDAWSQLHLYLVMKPESLLGPEAVCEWRLQHGKDP